MTQDEVIAELKHIIKETLWMARRYADGRSSIAVGMFNNCVHKLDDLEMSELLLPDNNDQRFANDGFFGVYNPTTKTYNRFTKSITDKKPPVINKS